MRKARAKSSARNTKKSPLKLPLPWLAISVLTIILVFITSDLLPKAENVLTPTPEPIKKPTVTEISSANSPFALTFEKIEVTPEEGDTLWSLAEEFYGNGAKWTVLASENNIRGMRLPMGKMLTVNGDKESPFVIRAEKLYQLTEAEDVATVTLPNGWQIDFPQPAPSICTSSDGSVTLSANNLMYKNNNRRHVYLLTEGRSGITLDNHSLTTLSGQNYAVYLYTDQTTPDLTYLALFNLSNLR